MAPDWPQGEGWHLWIDGDPTFKLHAEIGLNEGDEYTDKENLGTATHSIHAVPHVVAAEPGIKTVVDLGHIIAVACLRSRPPATSDRHTVVSMTC